MTTILATNKDLPLIMDMIDAARNIMRAAGNYSQWTNGYPSLSVIQNDIANNNGYLCVDDNNVPVGYFCFFQGIEPSYNTIYQGQWSNEEAYGVLHRMASTGKVRGVAQHCLDWALQQCNNIRIDTLHDNIPMQRILQKNNFQYCGMIYVHDGTPRDAFQKTI